jgi:hypothetical protein
MIRNTLKVLAVMTAATLLFPLSGGMTFAEGLNPEGINPHAEVPGKRISVERKMAAAEARKKKQAEIAARKAGQPAPITTTTQGASPAGTANDKLNSDK